MHALSQGLLRVPLLREGLLLPQPRPVRGGEARLLVCIGPVSPDTGGTRRRAKPRAGVGILCLFDACVLDGHQRDCRDRHANHTIAGSGTTLPVVPSPPTALLSVADRRARLQQLARGAVSSRGVHTSRLRGPAREETTPTSTGQGQRQGQGQADQGDAFTCPSPLPIQTKRNGRAGQGCRHRQRFPYKREGQHGDHNQQTVDVSRVSHA